MRRSERFFMIAATLWGACSSQELTPLERGALSSFVLRAVPPDPTNAVADDPRAAALGQALFFDGRFGPPRPPLDRSGAARPIACATCHDPSLTGAELESSPAAEAARLQRAYSERPSSVVNAAYFTWFYDDGHADSLWGQAAMAAEYDEELGSSRLRVAHVLYDHYRTPFEALFGPMPDLSDSARFPPDGKPGDAAYEAMAAADRFAVARVLAGFGKALAAYERTLVDRSSPFDRYMAGDQRAMSRAAVRGAKLFVGRASCNECHGGAVLGGGFGNIGVPSPPPYPIGRAGGLPLVQASELNTLGPFSDAPAASPLRGVVPRSFDLGAFKTRSLRNLRRKAPYMHTAAFATLWDVLVFYRDAAGTDGFAGKRSPAIQPLALSNDDLADLVAFLGALEGDPLPRALVTAPVLP